MKETLKDPYYCPHCGLWIEREHRPVHNRKECDEHLSKGSAMEARDKAMEEEWEARSKSGQSWFNC